ncbi:MAG: cytochrome c [Xanthomonadaceae bacterium]|nr:cytochrome c [Xanthomonadaceae bacterium]
MNKPLTIAAFAVALAACGQQPAEQPQAQQAQPERPATTPAQQPAQTPATASTPPSSTGPFELNGDAARGQAIYMANCSSCHGREGRGDGPVGRALRPPATDFTAAEAMTAERAYLVVRDGGMAANLAPTMAAFGRSLDDQQIHDVVAYVMQLKAGGD